MCPGAAAAVRLASRRAIAIALGALALHGVGCKRSSPPPPVPGAPAPAPAAAVPPDAPAPGLRRHEQRLFSIDLPLAFERVRHEDVGGPAHRPGDNVARFEDGRGRWLAVSFDPPGAGYVANATWRLEPAGDRVRVIAEEPPCQRAPYASSSAAMGRDEDDCPAGDGRLTVAASIDLGGHRFVFFFGDAAHERGVDLAPFRAALASFRVRTLAADAAHARPGG